MRMVGFNNIELISDRSIETNFREICEVKQRWPDRAVIASLMVDTRERWHEFVKRSADAGADGIELNFGCPHGMCERGMGSAVGQQPAVTEKIVGWVMEAATIPVIVKLTPNITDVTFAARAARKGGANAISLINTINSITQVNLDNLVPEPYVGGLSSHGGYCGPAVKPIALNMVQCCAADPEVRLPISGIGGIATWRDAAEFIALGSTSIQVCTAIMHYGFRIVEDMVDGPERLPRRQRDIESVTRACRQSRAYRQEVGDRWTCITSASPGSITTSASAATCATSPARTAPTSASTWCRRTATASARAASPANPSRKCARRTAWAATCVDRLPGGRMHHHGVHRRRPGADELERLPGEGRPWRNEAYPGTSVMVIHRVQVYPSKTPLPESGTACVEDCGGRQRRTPGQPRR